VSVDLDEFEDYWATLSDAERIVITRALKKALVQTPGYGGGRKGATATGPVSSNRSGSHKGPNSNGVEGWRHGGRPCAVFEYVGPAYEPKSEALAMFNEVHRKSRK